MLLSDCYDAIKLPLSASLYEIKEKQKKLLRKYHPDKIHGNPKKIAKFARMQAAYKEVIGYLEQRRDEEERREREQYEKEQLEYAIPPPREDPEGDKRREMEDIERKRKAEEVFLKNNEAKIQASKQLVAERLENSRSYMTTELLKICGNDVRHHTDDSGLEWYSVYDFIKQVHPNPGKNLKAVYKSWDKIKINPKIAPFIRSTHRYAGTNSMPEKTPAVTLWGLQTILTLLTDKKMRQEFHTLAKIANSSYISNPMQAA